ncbi:hypothetical protein [Rickettsiales endosymbiont of Stachyamoeba lipophora]|uniref:hypothetical protein n=1 Tax=Rickettsiales endosymbiont of Stachyamoeba lipophora TaxID=2486578 RepID=UPI000F64C227|nr:hypothetical protein [Rickettsiales endosymbiont of Stachyamoeba lipophora]AZL15268.1 hypothetical protein EF513_01685 [Rickettsiales endosymbiont of Stachyamoeba lipophora]
MSNPQNLSIILMGEICRDIAPHAVAENTIKQLHNLSIPIVYCNEASSELTAKDIYDTYINTNHFKDLEAFIKNNNLQKYIISKPNLYYSYLPFENHIKISEELRKAYPTAPQGLLPQLETGIQRLESDKKQVKLLETIISLKIPYIGIDDDVEEAHKHGTYDSSLELKRINNMIKGIYDRGIKQLNNNSGIIICQIGINHVGRLAASFTDYLKQHPNQKYNIQLLPIYISSPYVEDQIAHHKDFITETKREDSQVLQLLYQQVDVTECVFQEDAKTGNFSCQEYDQIIEQAIKHAKGKTQFFIPDLNETKLALIKSLNGEIILINERDNSGRILIDSAVLKKEQREKLGIDRKLMRGSGASFELRRSFLASFTEISVENTMNANEIIITFPNSRAELIDKVHKQWDLVIKEHEDIIKSLASKVSARSII